MRMSGSGFVLHSERWHSSLDSPHAHFYYMLHISWSGFQLQILSPPRYPCPLVYLTAALLAGGKKWQKTPPKQNKNIYLVNWKTFLSWNKKLQMMSEKSLLARCPSGFLNALRLSLHPGGCLPVCTHTLLIWPGTLTSCQTTNQMKLYYSYFLCSSGVKVWIILLTENNDK